MTLCITCNPVSHQKIADTLCFCLLFLCAVFVCSVSGHSSGLGMLSQTSPQAFGVFTPSPYPQSSYVSAQMCCKCFFFYLMKKELISLRQSEEIWCTIRSARISSGNKSAMPVSARWWEVVRLERTAVTNILWHSSHRKCVGCGSVCVKG